MSTKHNASDIFEKGLQYLSSGQEEIGIQFLQRAADLEPTNSEMLKVLGESLLEIGQTDKAKSVFMKASEVDPNDFSIFMYMGQAESGKEALRFYEKGIELLQKEAEDPDLQRQLCLAYCSVAELYMSDLCYEDDAELKCEEYLNLGLKVNPSNPQALQGFASLRLSQSRPEDAKPLVLQAYSIIDELLEMREKIENRDETDMEDEPLDLETLEQIMPPYEFRACTCRLLIEIGEYEKAISLLDALLNENDEIVEVWMLLGNCFVSLKEKKRAIEALDKAQEVSDLIISLDPTMKDDPQFSAMLGKIVTFRKQADEL